MACARLHHMRVGLQRLHHLAPRKLMLTGRAEDTDSSCAGICGGLEIVESLVPGERAVGLCKRFHVAALLAKAIRTHRTDASENVSITLSTRLLFDR